MLRRIVLALAGVMASATAQAASQPACAPPVEARGVRVIRVENNGVLVLEDGRAVKIEGLLLPGGVRDRAPQYLADEAIAVLADLTRGRVVTLAAQTPKEDRYGRLRAQVFVAEDAAEPWLEREMLHRGLGRVSVAPDRRECVTELYAAEDEARRNRKGIWSQPVYAVRRPTTALSGDADTFQVVQGTILSADVKNGRGYLDFGTDWRRDFTVTISPDDLKTFHAAGVDPQSYEGKTVRVRGWVEDLRRPEIDVAGPEDIEVLDPNEADASALKEDRATIQRKTGTNCSSTQNCPPLRGSE
jgi:micrococcal nuclease